MKQMIMAMAIVTALGVASGGLYGMRVAPPSDASAAEKPAPAPEERPTGASLQPNSGFYDLPPIVTNLGSPSETWVRLEASVIYDAKATPHPETLGAQITGDILAFLRSTSLTQIQGVIGLQNLRQDLNERVAIRSGGSAKELVIRTLVIQ
jgi:flagellar FliL protein